MGSSDRRMNTRYCYNYFRLGGAFSDLSATERLAIAEFLCETESAVVEAFRPEWTAMLEHPVEEKVAIVEELDPDFLQRVFPWTAQLSEAIDTRAFLISHFVQPDLFIRLRRGKEKQVMDALTKADVAFTVLSPQTLALPNGSKLQQVRGIDGLYEVQDLSSQQSLNLVTIRAKQSWWDCCAASGGKSLLLLDQEPDIKLMVSDIRLSILRNLDERFAAAGVRTYYRKKIVDLSDSVQHIMEKESFDAILLDAPCSGSGTWGRSPDMLCKFTTAEIDRFADLQKKIVRNAVPYLKDNGQLLYITCSVFAAENEEVVAFIEKELGLTLQAKENILGYGNKADSMFAAVFRKA